MRLDATELERLLTLARLDLDPQQRERLEPELERIVAYVSQLSGLGRCELPPTPDVPPDWLRPDQPGPGLERQQLLARAADVDADAPTVPSPIEDVS